MMQTHVCEHARILECNAHEVLPPCYVLSAVVLRNCFGFQSPSSHKQSYGVYKVSPQ